MAKSGKYTGVSFTGAELADPLPPVTITRAVLGGESQSPGNNSPTSTEKTSNVAGSQTGNPQKPVSSTESHSSLPGEVTDSAAPSAATGGPKTAPVSGRKRTASKKANVRSADGDDEDEFSDFE